MGSIQPYTQYAFFLHICTYGEVSFVKEVDKRSTNNNKMKIHYTLIEIMGSVSKIFYCITRCF